MRIMASTTTPTEATTPGGIISGGTPGGTIAGSIRLQDSTREPSSFKPADYIIYYC